jgi:hypothetical protein
VLLYTAVDKSLKTQTLKNSEKMSLSMLARSSLKQFSIILAEVRAEHGDISGEQLEDLMWEKILAGRAVSSGTKISSDALRKIKIQLPYLPDSINYVGCCALKTCGGLFVPCGSKLSEDSPYCLVCKKGDAKHGTLADRGEPGTYTDPQDKHEITYGTWLAKNEITIEDVHAELKEKGFTIPIPEEYLIVNTKREPKKRAGAPPKFKKTKVNSDGTESPIGSSLDGHDVILSSSSEESGEESENTKKLKKNVKAIKEMTPEQRAEKDAAKAAAKAEKDAAKAAKDAEKAAAKSAKDAEKAAAKAAKAESPKKTKTDEEKKVKEEKPKKTKTEEEKKVKEEKPKKTKTDEEKAKVEKPKPKPKVKAEKAKVESDQLEHEDETEVIDGEEYIVRGNQIFDLDGTIRGVKNEDGTNEMI